MTILQKQSIFSSLVATLIIRAETMGYKVTLGEAYRSPEEADRLSKLGKGIKNSLHTARLAIDLNLFDENGNYLAKTSDHKRLGEWWKSQSTNEYQCCWGGDFGDGNHYSIAHGGRK